MSGDVPSWSASFEISAREKNARGDSLIARLPLDPDRVTRCGEVANAYSGRLFAESSAEYRELGSNPHDLSAGVAALLTRLDAHYDAFRALGGAFAVSMKVVPYGCLAPWRLDFTQDVVRKLARWNALIDVDAYLWAPEGTEIGARCIYCGLDRPTSPDDRRIASLLSPGPADGASDARLLIEDVDAVDGERLRAACPIWGEYVERLRTFAAPAGQQPMAGKRWGAVALGTLLRAVRSSPEFLRLLGAAKSPPRVEARAWFNYFNVGARVLRRDVRRLANWTASFTFLLEAAPLPAISIDDGHCYHCDYVAPGFESSCAAQPSADV